MPAAVAVIVVSGVLALGACGGPGGDDGPTDNFDRRAMLANLGQNVLIPVYELFETRTGELSDAIEGYCAALGGADEATAQAAAQDAWRLAMDAWEQAEAALIGPAAMDSGALRDRIYSWPLVSSCAVDQDVMLKRDDPAYDIRTRLTNRRGLDALEYVLFAPSLDHTCPIQSEPIGWDALDDAQRRAARCAFAADAAIDVGEAAAIVTQAWSPSGGDFLGDLSRAGEAGSSFSSAQEAVNVVSDAMFYVDSEVKDMKLGEPAGIVPNRCGTVQEPCPDELELPHATYSKQSVAANLIGLEQVFIGGDGLGFDDFLIELGAGELAQTMRAELTAARAATDAIPGTLTEALTDDYASIAAAHAAVKLFTDNLKSQFLTVLGLEIPDGAAGDND
jgi:predicted lipoprotein